MSKAHMASVGRLGDADLHWLAEGLLPSREPADELDEFSRRVAHLNMTLKLCAAHDLAPDATTAAACRYELQRRAASPAWTATEWTPACA